MAGSHQETLSWGHWAKRWGEKEKSRLREKSGGMFRSAGSANVGAQKLLALNVANCAAAERSVQGGERTNSNFA